MPRRASGIYVFVFVVCFVVGGVMCVCFVRGGVGVFVCRVIYSLNSIETDR